MNKFLISLFLIVSALAQAMAWEAEPVVINPDNSVTFNAIFPDAEEVTLKGSLLPRKNLIRTEAGSIGRDGKIEMTRKGEYWTCTSAPLSSDFYTYYYEVDGNRRIDSRNPERIRDVADTLNYFIIGNGIADEYMVRDVPHGMVKKVWYPSSLPEMKKRRMTLYLPAGYGTDRERRYPVLYLLHGAGGDEDAWDECGRAKEILDNMMAEGRCTPMIVVMPNGNASLAAAPGEDPANPDVEPSGNNPTSLLGKIETVFVPEIVDYVDSHYRTIDDKTGRAISGISLGGLQALYIALNNPTYFDYIGLFSAQTVNPLDDKRINAIQKVGQAWNDLKSSLPFIGGGKVDRKIQNLTSSDLRIYDDTDKKLNALYNPNPPALFYIAYGKDDFVKKLNEELCGKMDDHGFSYTLNLSAGGHTWSNWRKYLIDYLPRLFGREMTF